MTEFFDLLRGMGFYAGGAASAVEILFRVTVLLLTAGAIAFCLRRSSAALKHLVWTLSVVGTLLIPLFYWAFPAWRWAVLPAPPVSLASGANDALIGAALPYTNHVASPTRDLPGEFSIAHTGQPAENATRAKIGGPAGQKTVFHGDLPSRPALSWPGIMAAVWGAGTFCFLAWTLTGIIGAWSVARRSEPGGGANWQYILHNLRDKCGISRGVEIRQCAQLSVPMTWGFLRPVILIPADSTLWPEDVKRSVLLHELGHIRRHDCLIHFLSRLALAGYWFHPLVWIAARQLRKTSEQAADDAVLSSQIAPPDYAEHLLRIAAGMRGMKWFAHAVLPMAGSSDLAGRVVAILDSNRNHRSITKITYFSLLTLTLMLLIPCAILRLGYAQDKTNPTTPANTSETFQILSGEVKNIDGKPIKGAIVAFNFGGMTLFHEAKTDAEGRFEIRNKSMSPTWVTVEADGYASKRQKLSAEIKGKSFFISLVLESAQTIRGRVVDTQGKPLAGVNVNTNATDFNNIPFFQTTTDRNGRFVWKYAPGNTIPIGLWAEGMMMKDQDLQASDKEHTITLDPQMHILGTIVDEETGKPINKFRFYIGGHKRNNDEITYELWDQGRKDNIFVIGNNQPFNEKDYIKIEADGYETITKEFQHSPGEQRLEIKMKRVNKPSAASQDNSEPAKQIKTIGGKVVDDAVKDASGSEKEKSSKKPAFTVHAVDAQSGEPIVKVPLEVVAQYLNKDKPETTKYSTDVNGDARVELNNGPFGNIFFYARAVGYV
ncbi:MAG: M56 family metallopeptidase, partial [Thermoguttaceae bacterium]